MADKRLKTRIQLLKNTDSYFSNLNPVTLNGEIYLVETDAGIKVKIGNGSAYNNLPYYEDSLLYTLGFDVDYATDGQILMFNDETGKWENVNLTDDDSIIYLDDSGLSIKGYDDARQGQMLVKDNNLGLAWIDPLSPTELNNAVAASERAAGNASNSAQIASNKAVEASASASTAERINQVTTEWVNDKFWWGTIEEYNALSEIKEGTFYHIMV